jgi:Protein of unknown function (DUF2478)
MYQRSDRKKKAMESETRGISGQSNGPADPLTPVARRLAAIVFERGEDVDGALNEFVDAARRGGARVAGLVQEHGDDGNRDLHDARVRDLASGATIPIMQDLGPEATGCRVDPRGVAAAAGLIGKAIEGEPDLIVVSRFGRLESEGGGMLAEIGDAVAQGVPVVISVPARYRDAWNDFAGGLDAQLPPRSADLEAWWAAIAPSVIDASSIGA